MMITVDFDDYGEKRTHENVQRSGRIAVILMHCQVSGGYEKELRTCTKNNSYLDKGK